MSPKKRTSKKEAKKKRPTKAMLEEISEVFERHELGGVTIQPLDSQSIGDLDLTGDFEDDSLGLAPTKESLNCILPEQPRYVCEASESGKIVCGWRCR